MLSPQPGVVGVGLGVGVGVGVGLGVGVGFGVFVGWWPPPPWVCAPDWPVALVEDLIAVGGSLLIVSRL